VFLGEYGWVPFEPTPQRGPPDAGNWLGIEPAQDTSRGGGASPSPDDGAGSGEGDGGPADIGAAGDDQRSPEGGLGEDGSATAPAATDRSPGLPQPLRDAARPLGALALAYAVIVPLAIAVQQLVRRRRASTPAARAQYLWRRAVDRASSVGVQLPPSMTIAEMADRIAHDMPSAADAVQALARTMEAIAYAETPPSPAEVERAREAWAAVVAESRRRRSWPRRALGYLDVRRLLAAPGERRTTHQAAELPSPA
jgi:hypothetical protein